jgi:hypothetical protein
MILAGVILFRLLVVLARRYGHLLYARPRESDGQYQGFLRFFARVRAASITRHS